MAPVPSPPAHGSAPPGESKWGASLLLERALPAGLLLLAMVSVPLLVFERDGLPRMRALQKELADVNQENQAMRRDIARLKAEVRDLRDDPAAIERIARDQLGLVRRSEVVFQFGRPR